MVKKHHRYFLKEKKTKEILLEISRIIGKDIEKLLGSKIRIEMDEIDTINLIILNGKPLMARSQGLLFPTLRYDIVFPLFPKIIVDMGAIPYVCKGADVMAPGLVSTRGLFKENEILFVIDEKYNKPLAVGLSIYNSEEIKTVKNGKILKNIHYIGDNLWNYLKRFY